MSPCLSLPTGRQGYCTGGLIKDLWSGNLARLNLCCVGEVDAIAIKRVLAWQIFQLMQEKGLTKTAMAQEMNTSRASLDRLLDPENTSVTLNTMVNAAKAVGKRLRIELV